MCCSALQLSETHWLVKLKVQFNIASISLVDAQMSRIRLPPTGYDTSGTDYDLWWKQPFYGGDVHGYFKHEVQYALRKIISAPATHAGQQVLELVPELQRLVLAWETQAAWSPPAALRGPRPPAVKGRKPDPPALKELKRKFKVYKKSVASTFKKNGNRPYGGIWLAPMDEQLVAFLRHTDIMDAHGNIVAANRILKESMTSLFKNYKCN